jgi:hypothetical protein
MTAADLLNLLRQKPFVPLRLHVSDGTIHVVPNPDRLWVGTGMAVLIVPLRDQVDLEKPMIERTVHIDLRHIVKVETESAPATP